jgi:hypothetical protein
MSYKLLQDKKQNVDNERLERAVYKENPSGKQNAVKNHFMMRVKKRKHYHTKRDKVFLSVAFKK